MTDADTYYKDHWVDFDEEMFDRYDRLFQIDPANADSAVAWVDVQPGEVVVDFGCGPGHTAVELAKRVGPGGHVHGVDVNTRFVERCADVAAQAGTEVAARCSWHLVTDEKIPLRDGSVDRVVCKNVLEYVPDVPAVLAEAARVLRPGGTLVVSDTDWGFVVIEPLGAELTFELLRAASGGFRDPYVARKLPYLLGRAGFEDVKLVIRPWVDRKGFLRSITRTASDYAIDLGRLTAEKQAEIEALVDRGLEEGSYLLVLPQWTLSARVPQP